jgi:hypothetical protein
MSTIRKFLFDRAQQPVTLAESVAVPHCANCSEALHGLYCSKCGQKKEGHHDLTVGHFVGHAVHEFTHFDSRVFSSFKYLLLKPGYLTEQFVSGHRKKFINPIRLFILVNIVYFIFVFFTGSNTFSTQLKYQVGGAGQQHQKEMVDNKVKELGIPYESYAKQFDHNTRGMAKSLIIVMVPIFALVAGLLFYQRKRYAIEYLAFSLEVYSMILMFLSIGLSIIILCSSLLLFLADKLLLLLHVIDVAQARQNVSFLASLLNDDHTMSTIIVIVGSALQFSAIKRVFRQSNFTTFIKTVLSVAAICYIIGFYRVILFYATFYTLHVAH